MDSENSSIIDDKLIGILIRTFETIRDFFLKLFFFYFLIISTWRAAILFIVEDVTYNICDQRFHEFQIRQMNPNVTVLRFSLTTLGQGAARLGPNKELMM